MPDELITALKSVVDEQTFHTFVQQLEKEQRTIGSITAKLRAGLHDEGNEYLHIADFLATAMEWALNNRTTLHEPSLWGRFAQFLYAGTITTDSPD